MPTYDVSTGLRALQGGNVVADIDVGFLALAQDVAARLPSLVSALPGAPYDGQEIYIVADATDGVLWHFRYRAASASAYKWEAVTSVPVVRFLDLPGLAVASLSGAASVFGDPSTGSAGPAWTIPFAGEYGIDTSTRGYVASLPAGGIQSVLIGTQVNAGAGQERTRVTMQNSGSTNGDKTDQASIETPLAFASGDVVKMVYARTQTAQFTGVLQRRLAVRPLRIG